MPGTPTMQNKNGLPPVWIKDDEMQMATMRHKTGYGAKRHKQLTADSYAFDRSTNQSTTVRESKNIVFSDDIFSENLRKVQDTINQREEVSDALTKGAQTAENEFGLTKEQQGRYESKLDQMRITRVESSINRNHARSMNRVKRKLD